MKPQYYKCINVDRGEGGFTLNKIYKIKNPNYFEDYGNFIDDNGCENGWAGTNYKHFEPSTEFEYNAQEGISNIPITTNCDYLIDIVNKLNIK